MTRSRNAPDYEDDFVAWLEDQAGRARRGEVEGLDLENSPFAEVRSPTEKTLLQLARDNWRGADSNHDCDRR